MAVLRFLITLTKKDPSVEKTERLFFPGCSLSSYSPEVVVNTYKYIKKVMPGTGFLLRCFSALTNMLGQEDKFETKKEELVAEIEKTGAKELITACFTCRASMTMVDKPALPFIRIYFFRSVAAGSK